MKMPSDSIVVLDIAGNTARLHCGSDFHGNELIEAGFSRSGNEFTRPIASNEDRQAIVRLLIEIGALFSSGKDWSPEEIVEMFKEQGRFNQEYRVISWRDPYTYFISTR